MKASKTIALILAALMIILAAASCAKNGNNAETTPSPAVTDATPSTEPEATTDGNLDEDGFLKDDLPEKFQYTDQFDILTWNNVQSWEWTTNYETTGDTIKDAIVKRQLSAEERTGVKISITGMAGQWEARNDFINAVVSSLAASGDQAYDLVGQYSFAAPIGTLRGAYVDLNKVKYLNLSQPWWPADITASSLINGKCFFATGDITCTLIRSMNCILTNLDLANDLKMPNFYELVDNKQWTAEKFLTYATGTVTGLNPDGTQSYTTTMTDNVTYDNLFYAGGFHYVDLVDGTMAMSEDLDSVRMEDWYDLWSRFLKSNDDVGFLGVAGTNGFTSGNVLFHFGSIADVQNYLQDITFKFAILPFPMYDENQENYCTICGAWVSYYSIPTNAPDEDMSGAVLEALASYGFRQITPAVYIASFQYRFLDSIENANVFDLLHNTLVFELGRQLGDQLNIFAAFRQAAQDTYSSWSSYYSGQKKAFGRTLTNIAKNPNIK